MSDQKNIFKHEFDIHKETREKLKKQKAFLIWFTGLSGSGKSTIANALEVELCNRKFHTYLLDGDNIRKGINSDLGFSPEDRSENIRRIGEIANLMIDAGLIVLASFVSPYKIDRQHVKNIVGSSNFIEVYVSTPLEVCEQQDTKGLYAKARKGEIKGFTGIDAPYEPPESADIIIDTGEVQITEAVGIILEEIQKKLNP